MFSLSLEKEKEKAKSKKQKEKIVQLVFTANLGFLSLHTQGFPCKRNGNGCTPIDSDKNGQWDYAICSWPQGG